MYVESATGLQAYGNSGMPRNDDSSRFGKLFKVYFNSETQVLLVGCGGMAMGHRGRGAVHQGVWVGHMGYGSDIWGMGYGSDIWGMG